MRIIRFLSVVSAALLAISVSAAAQRADALRVSILGDSYSTFDGWLTPDINAIWYFGEDSPYTCKDNDVKKVEQTWWYQVISDMGYKLEKNNSYSGATICFTGYKDQNGVHSDYSDRSFIVRASNLGNPDIILVCGGTNDSWCGAPIGEYKWKKWTDSDLYSFRPAMAKMCSELKTLYPEARILFILNSELKDEINSSVHLICKRYGIECLDLHDIDKQAGHPSQAGMISFAKQVEAFLQLRNLK